MKSTKPEHSSIILWSLKCDDNNNKKSYRQISSLHGHELTIVQMEFSHDGNYLLSVSRDRSWKLFKRISLNDGSFDYELVRGISSKNPYHTRIIWSCSWSHDDKYFITTSRDKRVCLWNGNSEVDEKVEQPISSFEASEAITACSFAPVLIENSKS